MCRPVDSKVVLQHLMSIMELDQAAAEAKKPEVVEPEPAPVVHKTNVSGMVIMKIMMIILEPRKALYL